MSEQSRRAQQCSCNCSACARRDGLVWEAQVARAVAEAQNGHDKSGERWLWSEKGGIEELIQAKVVGLRLHECSDSEAVPHLDGEGDRPSRLHGRRS